MSAAKSYTSKREIELATLPNRRHHFAELRFNPQIGQIADFSVGYKVWVGGEYVEIVRYDCEQGRLHRHAAGFPEPGPVEETFSSAEVPVNGRAGFVARHIHSNCEGWQSVLPIESKRSEPK